MPSPSRFGVVALFAFGLSAACSSSTPLNGNGGSTGSGGSGGSASGGSTGLAGATGAAGNPGSGGTAGGAGVVGTAGTKGSGGTGIAGMIGTAGTKGSGGATGGTGATGSGGAAGHAGAAGTAGTSGRVPVKHRAAAVSCAMDRSASTCPAATMPDAGAAIMCLRDADCTGGTNGRCDPSLRTIGCQCSYDQCFADADCTLGGPCECRPPAITAGQGIGTTPTNNCKPGNCRLDKDCGAGGYCSPSLGPCGNYAGVTGYFCHTPKDKCIDDADCATQGGGDCRYNQVGAAWECQTSQCAG